MCLQIDAENKVCVKHRQTQVDIQVRLHVSHQHWKHGNGAMHTNPNLIKATWKKYTNLDVCTRKFLFNWTEKTDLKKENYYKWQQLNLFM